MEEENQKMTQPRILEGMKSIADFLGRSESTVLRWIKAYSLDEKKIIYKRGGIWIANYSKLDQWWFYGDDDENPEPFLEFKKDEKADHKKCRW